jgi:hypothetical protein
MNPNKQLLKAICEFMLAAKETMTASEHMRVFEEHEGALLAAITKVVEGGQA